MGFGKSKARMLTESSKRVTFDDVAGVEEAKEEVEEIVDFLKDPQRFQRLGGKIPRGALLVGPPGTGKTLLARAIAGEANVPFFTISGSDFVEMFVGVGASRVRDMFEQAKKNAPCIVFIDEIDAVGRHRGAGLGGGNDEREQTLNQLLVEMDGFEDNEGVIIISATNRPDVLDPALLRPGRFDRQIVVPNPDVTGREKILKVHMRNVPLAPDVKAMTIARGTPGFSGADLANLVNEAALLAARRGKKIVAMQEFEDAKDKVMMGPERRSMVMSEKEKELTAYHEAGHALMTFNVPDTDPIHKATIIPRGRALGMVMQLPEADKLSQSREQMHSRLAVLMGGRVAEEQIFGYDKVTSGASSDISQATKLARAMVTQWGMSDKLGPLAYGDNQQEVFLGHSVAQTQNISEETAELIDEEIRRIVDESYELTKNVLQEKADDLHKIAQALIEYETLTGDELRTLLDGGDIDRQDDAPDEPTTPGKPQTVPSAGRPKPNLGGSPEPQGT
jgi:cell division protease FtsH